jgi:hypothetical protein
MSYILDRDMAYLMKTILQAVPNPEKSAKKPGEKPTIRDLVGTTTDKALMAKDVGPPWARAQITAKIVEKPLLEDLIDKAGPSDKEKDFAADTVALVKKE